MSTSPTVPAGAVPLARRSLAPDLARGAMLLLIALAHGHTYLSGHQVGLHGYALSGGGLDRVAAGVQIALVDGRALPMFAALFGYGLVQIVRRQEASGREWPHIRRILRRRGWWMIAFGACHALLLFSGDILGAYGLVGLLLAGFVRRSDRAVLRAAGGFLAGYVVMSAAYGWLTVAPETDDALDMAATVQAAALRLVVWIVSTTAVLLVHVIPPFLVGIWAARRRVLEEPVRHRALLRRTAATGLAAALLGGLPLALTGARLWAPSDAVAVSAYVLHSVTGVLGGLGYAALVGLVAGRVTHGGSAPSRPVRALAACGQWSLTCYLLQSVAFVALFAPYAGGLGTRIGGAAASGIAVAVWLSTVALAATLAPRGHRGPAETALRRLTYGTRSPGRGRPAPGTA
ncbi:DUF418 domain-containing protein [Streptomyces sp. ODS28]|uniref:DUF418 domain-containing protein n=1 Tax=Streptomyces sp. ODS28 TaxID=3136688 RepID=UPI0031F17509